jgi:hypothetical protein
LQNTPSSQLTADPWQVPAEQVSPAVQAFPSLQGAELFTWVQPVAGLQPSRVQTFPSSQFLAPAPPHTPAVQVSVGVHAFPSLQAVPSLTATCLQPVTGSQESAVQGFWSLQFVGPPPPHEPMPQLSPAVHGLPSLHAGPDSGEHVPAVTLHAWQSVVTPPPQAVSQQKPSTQWVCAHCALRVQASPFGSMALHLPRALQKKPPGQSVSRPQLPWHAEPAMLQGSVPHDRVV